MKDYYKILEVDSEATQERIKEQYRFLLHAWHPDKFSSKDQKGKAEARVRELNEAYDVVGDSAKREQYDEQFKFFTSNGKEAERTGASFRPSCDHCGSYAKTKNIAFYEIIGKGFKREHSAIKGKLCKPCINYYFWYLTGRTVLLGWWGIPSVFLTPVIALNNLFRFLFTIGMKMPGIRFAPRPPRFWLYSTISVLGLFFQSFLAAGLGMALNIDAALAATMEPGAPSVADDTRASQGGMAAAIFGCIPENTTRETALVTGIIDGDTVDVLIDGQQYRVQYIGVDTPERGHALFWQATSFNHDLVYNQTVTLVKDVSEIDGFGRLLRYVIAGDSFVNFELVRSGYARAAEFPPDVACLAVFAGAQEQAQANETGIWMPLPNAQPLTVPAPTLDGNAGNCDPAYPTVCIPPLPPDLDCKDIPHKMFQVLPPDPHFFDVDGDGIGCEG